MDSKNNIINLSQHIKYRRAFLWEDKPLVSIIPKANLLRRCASMIIDMSILCLFNLLIFQAFTQFIMQYLYFVPTGIQHQIISASTAVYTGTFILTYLTYFFYFSYLHRGETFGKKLMGLTVISESLLNENKLGSLELTYSQAMQRTLGYFLCYISFGTFYIFNFASEDKRGLSDFFSNSRTVCSEWFHDFQSQKQVYAEVVEIDIKHLSKVA